MSGPNIAKKSLEPKELYWNMYFEKKISYSFVSWVSLLLPCFKPMFPSLNEVEIAVFVV